mmetsp:Transcript_26661/g.61729  ORF Transcript_26661/g.61729 Transcript_26661/m.61729 type:complete len:272 (-) Transcript_26661:105-920(-)
MPCCRTIAAHMSACSPSARRRCVACSPCARRRPLRGWPLQAPPRTPAGRRQGGWSPRLPRCWGPTCSCRGRIRPPRLQLPSSRRRTVGRCKAVPPAWPFPQVGRCTRRRWEAQSPRRSRVRAQASCRCSLRGRRSAPAPRRAARRSRRSKRCSRRRCPSVITTDIAEARAHCHQAVFHFTCCLCSLGHGAASPGGASTLAKPNCPNRSAPIITAPRSSEARHLREAGDFEVRRRSHIAAHVRLPTARCGQATTRNTVSPRPSWIAILSSGA